MLHFKASKNYLRNNVEMLLNTQPGRASKILKVVVARPGEDVDALNFTLPQFNDTDKSKNEIADEVADYFAKISQGFTPVDVQKLPAEVRNEILSYEIHEVPNIDEAVVSELLQKVVRTRKPTSGDIPPILFKVTVNTVTKPITHLFNTVA